MWNNINSRWLSKSKNVEVLNYSGATSSDIIRELDDVFLVDQPESLIVYVCTNNLATDINSFSKIKICKGKKNSEKLCADKNSRFQSYYIKKNINNDKFKKSNLGVKK